MADREKLINELANDIAFHCPDMVENGCGVYNCASCLAERLADDGYHKAVQERISVDERIPQNFVSVLGYMTDAGEFPPVRECYTVGNAFFFPALGDVHPVSHWCEMPQPPKGE